MAGIIRFGVSMEAELLREFDRFLKRYGFPNRSEAVRRLVRDRLTQEEWEIPEAEAIGTITLIYDHERRELPERLTDLQHHFHRNIISTMHIHLDEHNCLEVLAIRGKASTIRTMASRLLGTRGLKHGKLTIAAAKALLKGQAK